MKKIKVTRGACGISYTDEAGAKRYATKTAEDGAFEYEDEKAARLVARGVAEYVSEESEKTESPDLRELTVKELVKMAGDLGVDVSKCRKKAEYIAAITESNDTDDEEKDDEEKDDDEEGGDEDSPFNQEEKGNYLPKE